MMSVLGRDEDQIQLWKKAWGKLTPKQRVELLRRLGVREEISTSHINLNRVRLVDDFRSLPMAVMMLLRQSFNGAVFSKACLERVRSCRDIELVCLG